MKNVSSVGRIMISFMLTISVAIMFGQAYRPKVKESEAISVAKSFSKLMGIDLMNVSSVKLLPQFDKSNYPDWDIVDRVDASVKVSAEYGFVTYFVNKKREYDLLTGRQKSKVIRIDSGMAEEYAMQQARRIGCPKDSFVRRLDYKLNGEGAPYLFAEIDQKVGGFKFLDSAPWCTIFIDITDGIVYKYTRFAEKRVRLSAKKIDASAASTVALGEYKRLLKFKKYGEPRKLSSKDVGYVRCDYGWEIESAVKPIRGIRQFRLGWLFRYGGDSVAVDAESGKLLYVYLERRPTKPIR